MTEFGTEFWRTLKSALEAAGWRLDAARDRLGHAGAGLEVRLLTGRTVQLRRADGEGQQLLTSRRGTPVAAALDVAAQVRQRLLAATGEGARACRLQ